MDDVDGGHQEAGDRRGQLADHTFDHRLRGGFGRWVGWLAIVAVGGLIDLIQTRDVDAGDRLPGAASSPSRRFAGRFPGLMSVNDVVDHLFALADGKSVDEGCTSARG